MVCEQWLIAFIGSTTTKIHRQIIASGREWKPCVECGRTFEAGEILTAIDTESNTGVVYWFGEQCTERYYGHLLRVGWRKTWRLRRRDGSNDEVDWDRAG